MAIVMNMSNYEIESDSVDTQYGKATSSPEWQLPVARLIQHEFVISNKQTTMPGDFAPVNVELFLQRMEH